MTISSMLVLAALLLQNTAATATFEGEFKSADKRYVVVEVQEGGTLRMFITRSTRFIREGKPARASDFHAGENVTVEAQRDLRMNMLAVRIESGKAAADKPK